MNGKVKIVIGVIVIMAAIVYIITSGLQKTMIPFLSVSEFVEQGRPLDRLKLTGFVMDGTLVEAKDGLNVKFDLGEGDEVVEVRYRGVTSDVFGEGIDVVVEGSYLGEGYFKASSIITKCPSKYEERIEEPDDSTASKDSVPENMKVVENAQSSEGVKNIEEIGSEESTEGAGE